MTEINELVIDGGQAVSAEWVLTGSSRSRTSAGANVLLDLDGTLTDPLIGFVASIGHAFSGLGLPPIPAESIARHIGPPLKETLTILLGPEHAHLLPAATALYGERYLAQGVFECTVYDGIPSALQGLRQSGARLFLATSKPHILAQRILDHVGLAPLFSAVYGAELDDTGSDKLQLLAHILERESLDPEATVMVGDRAQDIWAARGNGLSAIGVLWGYGSRQELESAGATTIIESPMSLLDNISA